MRSLFDKIWGFLFFIFFFLLTFSHSFSEGFIWKLRRSALWLVFIFSHLNVKSMSMRKGVILLCSDFSKELEKLIFWVFNPKVLLISMIVIEVSSIFMSEVLMIFVRFLNCVGFIVYVFEMIITFPLFVELISTKIIKGVLSGYRIWKSYLFVIVFKATLLIRSQLKLKTLY